MNNSVAVQQSFTFSSARSNLKKPLFFDPALLLVALGLVLFSLVMLYSTTAVVALEKFGDPFFYVKRQAAAAIVGMMLLALASLVPLDLIKKISPFLLPILLFFLILTFIPGLGDRAGGAQRWIKFGPLRFQPAEFVKLMFVIFMSGYWARHETVLQDFTTGIVKPVLLSGLVGGLLLLQPDFGSASIVVLVTLGVALAVGAKIRYLGAGLVAVASAAAVLVIVSPYRMSRVMSFMSPFRDAAGKGYQLIQSLIAVGSGQLTGVGLGSSQQKLFYLPAAHTDFLFAVVAEELGFVGGLVVIIAFLLLMWRGLKIANRVAEDTFSFSLAIGLTLLIVVPAFLNVGVVIGLLPTKGLVLPLVGYGGSSMIASLVAVGLLLAIARSVYTEHV